jgi:hypothetical protein
MQLLCLDVMNQIDLQVKPHLVVLDQVLPHWLCESVLAADAGASLWACVA